MSYGSQRSSRRGSGRGRGKVHSEKKRKGHKHHSGGKYLVEADEAPTFGEVAEMTLGRLSNLGDQAFACSPFSQYFDDWLLSLKSVISGFESNPSIAVDEEFVKERTQVNSEIERKLAKRRSEEVVLEKAARMLSKQRNLLIQTDAEHDRATQKLESQRNSEVKNLNRRVHEFEEELEETNKIKASIFSPFARRAKSHKTAEVTRKLDAAKNELESAVKAFEVEEAKLLDKYEKKEQAIKEQVLSLEKKIGGSETDGSVEDRKIACEKLTKAVQALIQRKTLQ